MMAVSPEWAAALRKIETMPIDISSVAGVFDRWIDGESSAAEADQALSAVMLGAIDIDDPKAGRRRALAIPARINELTERLGTTYWQTLAKAPPRIVISRSATHRIRDVRYAALLLDVDAWRAWALEHRDPASMTNEELMGFVDRLVALAEERQGIMDIEKEVLAEAKGRGWDTKALRKVVSLVKTEDGVPGWQEFSSMVDLYLANIGRDPTCPEDEEFAQSSS
jgi:uncharacterized protein (UPF0335 family)